MIPNNIKYRKDLSEWVIHFVHDRQPQDNLQDLQEIAELEGYHGDMRLPDYYDEKGDGHHVMTEYDENEYAIDANASAFEVLQKILHDGFIHSGWSLRNSKPTIYGPKSAVCFTEMPLHALVEYAKFRGEYSGYVGNYGIALRRNELFAAGARPVIYGLSCKHVEAELAPNGVFQGRILDVEKTGIPLHEQYRYVRTEIPKNIYDKTVDWTHEREWRWALPNDSLGVSGLPFFLSKEYADFFSDIIIIVSTDEERTEVLSFLKNLFDSESTNHGYEYAVNKIAAAKVLSLETISKLHSENEVIRIDDLDLKQIPIMPTITVSEETERKAREVIYQAGQIAVRTVSDYLDAHPEFDDQKGDWGWATVCTSIQSEVTQALQNVGVCHTYSDGIYRLSIEEYKTSNLDLLYKGAYAAAKFLTKELGQEFYVRTRLD